MTLQLLREVTELLNDEESVKVLSTVGEDGFPHAVVKQSIQINEDGLIEYLELLESSQSYKNFTRSLWFNGRVSVTVKGNGGLSYQIKGRPLRIAVCGPVFEKHYTSIREKLGDVDLAAVCVIDPEEVLEQSYRVRLHEQETDRPIFKHLDRLAK